MAANIFVDIASTAQMTEGDCTSLCEFFRQYVNKKTDADIHTKPAVILVEDDSLKIFSSKANFEFESASGTVKRHCKLQIPQDCAIRNGHFRAVLRRRFSLRHPKLSQ